VCFSPTAQPISSKPARNNAIQSKVTS
jgi:hypothetical protein